MNPRESELKVNLIAYTPEPERVVATAMRQSRFKGGVTGLDLTKEKIRHLVDLALQLGHLSVFEHISFTFAIEGISRACSHQLVRHRLFSFTQQSQRYVREENFPYIIPDTIKQNKEAYAEFIEVIEVISKTYGDLAKIVPIEDARFILPNATETKIVATANARELMHFFKLRLDSAAQWEIRALARKMFNLVNGVAPMIFSKEHLNKFQ
ncbi:MAG: FAD-dependent thymidylate synthase [Caldisericaceae bacterium]|nr:FAD-dependent thymidylate synthase [Caldisericaceae bacterium]